MEKVKDRFALAAEVRNYVDRSNGSIGHGFATGNCYDAILVCREIIKRDDCKKSSTCVQAVRATIECAHTCKGLRSHGNDLSCDDLKKWLKKNSSTGK